MALVLPVINNKGGVGKTTTSINLAAGLARKRGRVLLVDLDSQGSASFALGLERDALTPSSAEMLFGDVSVHDAVRQTAVPRLDLVPGALGLADADLRLSAFAQRETRLREVLRPVQADYDVILLDCAPSTSLLSVNALLAADALVIPLTPTYLALEGIVSLGEVVRQVRTSIGQVAPVLGIVLTMVDEQRTETQEAVRAIRGHYGDKVFASTIHPDPALEQAASYGQPIFDFAAEARGARDYERLVDEVIERLDRLGGAAPRRPVARPVITKHVVQ